MRSASVVKFAYLVLLISAAASAQRLPPGVPSDFVFTPNGYFHPSCIVRVSHDDVLNEDGSVRAPDSNLRGPVHCAYPHYDGAGRPLSPERAPAIEPSASNPNWKADAEISSPSVDNISAQWTVPSNMTSTIDVVYFFPGLEDDVAPSGSITILQPVLGWNASGGPSGWSITSWNCCISGTQFESTAIAVSPGDTIVGSVAGSNCNTTTNVCSNWQVTTTDYHGSAIASTTLNTAASYNFNNTWGGVLESYFVSNCGDYPSTGSLTFGSISVHQLGGGYFTPSWANTIESRTPACVTCMSSAGNSVQIGWATNMTCPGSTACVNFSTDNNNCGSCGNACFGTQICSSGLCRCRATLICTPPKIWDDASCSCTL